MKNHTIIVDRNTPHVLFSERVILQQFNYSGDQDYIKG